EWPDPADESDEAQRIRNGRAKWWRINILKNRLGGESSKHGFSSGTWFWSLPGEENGEEAEILTIPEVDSMDSSASSRTSPSNINKLLNYLYDEDAPTPQESEESIEAGPGTVRETGFSGDFDPPSGSAPKSPVSNGEAPSPQSWVAPGHDRID